VAADDAIRLMIRQALAEELGKLRRDGLLAGSVRQQQRREEVVSIRSDSELAAFVQRLADILKDGKSRQEIETGRWVFRLGNPEARGETGASLDRRGAVPSAAAPAAAVARIDRGVLSERQIEALPEGTTRLSVGRSVRLTPLALDRLRQRGITLERSTT
jgi:hypothetical protein